jgi:hypothetical protein
VISGDADDAEASHDEHARNRDGGRDAAAPSPADVSAIDEVTQYLSLHFFFPRGNVSYLTDAREAQKF